MLTYQDFLEVKNRGNQREIYDFILKVINEHRSSDMYKIALDADEYDKQQNSTIMNYIKYMYNSVGHKVVDFTASNTKICSNFFHRLNTQRNTYLLGNGVYFSKHKKEILNDDGSTTVIDETNEKLGDRFDIAVKECGYNGLIHGVCFGFWDIDHINVLPLTEFAPLWDEETSELRAGIRFWQLDAEKPLMIWFYEEDGFTKFKKTKTDATLVEVEPKRGYIKVTKESKLNGVEETRYSNYEGFPIVPLWGSKLHQSTLVGMKGKIDAYDLVKSGFANDLQDVAEVYWLLNGASGMDEKDISDFRRRLKLNHMAVVDEENSSATPYTQEIPYQARETFLSDIRASIYEDFGGLDVHTISAGATNDHIDAGYQPMDEEADDFEYQVTQFILAILKLAGIDDAPVFKRNKISNQKEQTDMVLSSAEYLDDETILNKLPFVTAEEVSSIIAKKDKERQEQAEMQANALQIMSGAQGGEEPTEE